MVTTIVIQILLPSPSIYEEQYRDIKYTIYFDMA